MKSYHEGWSRLEYDQGAHDHTDGTDTEDTPLEVELGLATGTIAAASDLANAARGAVTHTSRNARSTPENARGSSND